MHPITQAERGSYTSQNHYPMVRMLVSATSTGINTPGEVLVFGTTWTGEIPVNGRGIKAFKPSMERILGEDPLVSFTVNGDLDQLVTDATITLKEGQGLGTLSSLAMLIDTTAYGVSWEWEDFDINNRWRALLDAGVYVQLEAKIISPDPRLVVQEAPHFSEKGPVASTAGAVDLPVAWPPHIRNDIGLLVINSDATAPGVVDLTGWTAVPGSPQTADLTGTDNDVRLDVYWRRATGSAMASPILHNNGDHLIAQITTWRGCIETGNPWDVTPAGNTAITGSAFFATPTLTLTTPNNRVVGIVAVPTDMTGGILNLTAGNLPVLVGAVGEAPNPEMRINSNFSRDKGSGGGIAVMSLPKTKGGGLGFATVSGGYNHTAAAQARLILALTPPAPVIEVDTPDSVDWHPFFTGRIDSSEPTDDGHIVLRCRDLYSDLLDGWIADPAPLDSEDIASLLTSLFAQRPQTAVEPDTTGLLFGIIGEPEMVVPEYVQQPMPVLQAMREAGLQNGWDLRGRYGTAPYDIDQYVLTYYEPDRELAGFPMTFEPWHYFKMGSSGKDRDEVRNDVRVTPADPPRTVQINIDEKSQLKYGVKLLSISEDATSLILDETQADLLGFSILQDLKEPKTFAELEVRFYPWVEVNDVVHVGPNDLQLPDFGGGLTAAVMGYSHSYSAQGIAKTTLRLRTNPAAANREWRQTKPKMSYAKSEDPAGPAAEGARWYHTRG